MTVPADERRHWADAAQRVREAAPGGDMAADPPPEDPRVGALLGEMAHLEQLCPVLLETMEAGLRPTPDPALVMDRSEGMTFGERAAYRMGQDSVYLWLAGMIEESKKPPEIPATEDDDG